MTIFGANNYCTPTDPAWSGKTKSYMHWMSVNRRLLQRKSLRNLVFDSPRAPIKSYGKTSKIWFSPHSKKVGPFFLFPQRALPESIGYFRFKWISWSKKNPSDFYYDVIFRRQIWLEDAQNNEASQCLNDGHFLKSCLKVLIFTYIISVTKCLRSEKISFKS